MESEDLFEEECGGSVVEENVWEHRGLVYRKELFGFHFFILMTPRLKVAHGKLTLKPA